MSRYVVVMSDGSYLGCATIAPEGNQMNTIEEKDKAAVFNTLPDAEAIASLSFVKGSIEHA